MRWPMLADVVYVQILASFIERVDVFLIALSGFWICLGTSCLHAILVLFAYVLIPREGPNPLTKHENHGLKKGGYGVL